MGTICPHYAPFPC